MCVFVCLSVSTAIYVPVSGLSVLVDGGPHQEVAAFTARSLLRDRHGHLCPWLLAPCPQSCGKSVNQLIVHLFIPLDQKTGADPHNHPRQICGHGGTSVVAGDGKSRVFSLEKKKKVGLQLAFH